MPVIRRLAWTMQAGRTHPEEELQQQSQSFLLLLYGDDGEPDCSKASSTESNPKWHVQQTVASWCCCQPSVQPSSGRSSLHVLFYDLEANCSSVLHVDYLAPLFYKYSFCNDIKGMRTVEKQLFKNKYCPLPAARWITCGKLQTGSSIALASPAPCGPPGLDLHRINSLFIRLKTQKLQTEAASSDDLPPLWTKANRWIILATSC